MKVAIVLLITMISMTATAQSGGGFEITEAVIAGGGTASSNGSVEVNGTAGQAAAGGAIGGGDFSITNGFWNFTSLAPTAGPVSISGRVISPTGAGVFGAVVNLLMRDGTILTVPSTNFGYYRFDGIEAGQTVVISVQSKRYSYSPRVVNAVDEITGVDFIPD